MATRPPAQPPRRKKPAAARPARAARLVAGGPARPWRRKILIGGGIVALLCLVVLIYAWIRVAGMIDKRLGGGDDRPMPRIYGRAFEMHAGQPLSVAELRARLNDVGYSEKPKAEHPGEFSIAGSAIQLMTKGLPPAGSVSARIEIGKGNYIAKVVAPGPKGAAIDSITLEPPLLAELATGQRRRYIPISAMPKRMINAVLAIEDRRFYEHPGVDPIGTMGALWRNVFGNKEYLAGGSTITQQIVKRTFLTPKKTPTRKLQEQFIALVMETRLTKDQILELYMNEVPLGQRGPFEIQGFAEAARVFFGVDVQNLTNAQAATLAGIIQAPSSLSPSRNPQRSLERRNVVLKEMADAGFITVAEKVKAQAEPIGVAPHAMENEAPYFVDWVSQKIDEEYKGLLKPNANVDVFTTLDVHMQRMAQDALAEGLALVDKQLAARKRKGIAQAAMVVADPRTGEILAMIGGRDYSQSQYNRAVLARRQPGSTFKPFVYLSAFEKMAETGGRELTPATIMVDEPTTWIDDQGQPYTPSNYQNEYEGPVTLRFGLAHSRNIVAIKTAEQTGYDRVADLWKRVGEGTRALAVPSIALGVFEASPLEMTTAYTIFDNAGSVRPLQPILRISENGQEKKTKTEGLRAVARPDTTYLVVNMMRSVINEGTAAAARASFKLDAAGKTGTTNDQRDAWFIGFTPDLIAAVWVGFDNNAPIGLTGSQAALPIWTSFMRRATAGRADRAFTVPDGIVFVDIDKETGKLATPGCPKVIREAFLVGTEPTEACPVHR
ncbi:MAG: PBP1A family penicillin-binding protein [Acidobacteria bacterium]|nr:MAG: PBP1A family penicillin-binding protein [Acidobacteriota bacterium]